MERIEAEEVDLFGAVCFIVIADEVGDYVYSGVRDGWVLFADLSADIEITAANIGDGGDVVCSYIVADEVDVFGAGLVVRA